MEKSGISGIDERPELPPELPVAPLLPDEPPLEPPGMVAEAVEVEPLFPDEPWAPGMEALEPLEPPPGEGMLALDEDDPEEPELELEELELDELELDELELDELELEELGIDGLGIDALGIEGCDDCCWELVSQALSSRPPAAASNSPRTAGGQRLPRRVLSEVLLRYFMSLSTFQKMPQPAAPHPGTGQYQYGRRSTTSSVSTGSPFSIRGRNRIERRFRLRRDPTSSIVTGSPPITST